MTNTAQKKSRRKSFDETLLNPFKTFVGNVRSRRQSYSHSEVEKAEIELNIKRPERRRRKSEYELLAKDRKLLTRSSSTRETTTTNRRHIAPPVLRRMIRRTSRELSLEERFNILNRKPSSDSNKGVREPPVKINVALVTPLKDEAPGGKNNLTRSEYSMKTSIKGERTLTQSPKGSPNHTPKGSLSGSYCSVSKSSESVSSNEQIFKDAPLSTSYSGLHLIVNRSLSTGDVLSTIENPSSEIPPTTRALRRQCSLREGGSSKNLNVASPMILRKSHEKLYCGDNSCGDNSSLEDIENHINRQKTSPKKKKNFIRPLVNRIRRSSSLGRDEYVVTKTFLKLDNKRLQNIVYNVIEEKMKHVDYDHRYSNDRCRVLSTSIENAIKVRLEVERTYKVVALVFIGETRDHGINFATQCSYQPSEDLFSTATYETENMFVCAVVLASQLTDTIMQSFGA